MADFYKGTDFIGRFNLTGIELNDIVQMKCAIYTDGDFVLEYDVEDGYSKTYGGFKEDDGTIVLLIPSNRLINLNAGTISYELNLGVVNTSFPDDVFNKVVTGNFGVELKDTKASF
jgi:hypothetical protein